MVVNAFSNLPCIEVYCKPLDTKMYGAFSLTEKVFGKEKRTKAKFHPISHFTAHQRPGTLGD